MSEIICSECGEGTYFLVGGGVAVCRCCQKHVVIARDLDLYDGEVIEVDGNGTLVVVDRY